MYGLSQLETALQCNAQTHNGLQLVRAKQTWKLNTGRLKLCGDSGDFVDTYQIWMGFKRTSLIRLQKQRCRSRARKINKRSFSYSHLKFSGRISQWFENLNINWVSFDTSTNLTVLLRDMMTSSNGNSFRVTAWLFVRESTGHRWIPLTKASDAGLWCFLWSASEKMVE